MTAAKIALEVLAAAAKKRGDAPSQWTLRSILLWSAIGALLLGLAWVRLNDAGLWAGFDPDDIDMTTKPPSEQEDYYTVLQLSRTASVKEIKAAYRRLVLTVHPDKHPDCDDCIGKFQRVQKAYDVLVSPEKRSMYDTIETTYDILKSDTTELTSGNFDSEVLQTDSVYVIQVYTDWHKSAIRFSQAWEESASRYGQLVKFGRVHAQRGRELMKRLPVKFNVIPAVVIYANGQFSTAKTFLDSSRQALGKLANFIAQHFPNTVEPVAPTRLAMRDFLQANADRDDQATVLLVPDFFKNAQRVQKMNQQSGRGGSHQQRYQQQVVQTDVNAVNEPSLTYKAIARKFEYSFQFGQVSQLRDPNSWRAWLKNVSVVFQLAPPKTLPALLYQEAGEHQPLWLTGDLDKAKLLMHITAMHRRFVPTFNSHSYARHCAEGASTTAGQKSAAENICVLALACQPLAGGGDLAINTFASSARNLQKQSAFRAAPLQFAKVDVTKQTDMAPLCQALPEEAQKSTELQIGTSSARARRVHVRVASR